VESGGDSPPVRQLSDMSGRFGSALPQERHAAVARSSVIRRGEALPRPLSGCGGGWRATHASPLRNTIPLRRGEACLAPLSECGGGWRATHASPLPNTIPLRRGEACLALFQSAAADGGRRMRRPYETRSPFVRARHASPSFRVRRRMEGDACVAPTKHDPLRRGEACLAGLLLLMQGDACVAPTEARLFHHVGRFTSAPDRAAGSRYRGPQSARCRCRRTGRLH
jgi:hypothetical protein